MPGLTHNKSSNANQSFPLLDEYSGSSQNVNGTSGFGPPSYTEGHLVQNSDKNANNALYFDGLGAKNANDAAILQGVTIALTLGVCMSAAGIVSSWLAFSQAPEPGFWIQFRGIFRRILAVK